MTGPPRELARSERAAIRRLVTGLCANYDEREKLCLPLDCPCYMLHKWWTGGLCRYFEQSVLPVEPALEAVLTGNDTSQRQKNARMREAVSSRHQPGVLFCHLPDLGQTGRG